MTWPRDDAHRERILQALKDAPMTEPIAATLAERNTTYGDFTFDAQLADNIIRAMEAHASWHSTLNGVQRHALRIIALKMARIINGDPNYADSWHDIQGYAKLAEDRCTPKPRQPTRQEMDSAALESKNPG